MNRWIVYLFLITTSFLAMLGQVFFKLATRDIDRFDFKLILFNVNLWVGLIFFGMGVVSWIIGLKFLNLSKAYPLFTFLTFILVILASVIFLNEKLTYLNIGGIIFIIIGIILMQF